MSELDLHPRPRQTRSVARLRILRDESLESPALDCLPCRRSVGFQTPDGKHHLRVGDRFLKDGASSYEGKGADILPPYLEDVEGDEHRGGAEDARVGVPEEMEPGDELLVEDSDFPVEDEDIGTELRDGGGDFREAAGMVNGIPTEEADAPGVCSRPSEAVKNQEVCVLPLSSVTLSYGRMREKKERAHTSRRMTGGPD